jgi:hypothetical protein
MLQSKRDVSALEQKQHYIAERVSIRPKIDIVLANEPRQDRHVRAWSSKLEKQAKPHAPPQHPP